MITERVFLAIEEYINRTNRSPNTLFLTPGLHRDLTTECGELILSNRNSWSLVTKFAGLTVVRIEPEFRDVLPDGEPIVGEL